jgi:uncharacterized protein (DUF697 family)
MSEYARMLRGVLAGDLDGVSPEEKDRAVWNLIHTASAAASLVALQPIPFVDPLLLIPIHVGLVQGIARLRGYHLTRKSVLEILRALRMSILTQHAIMSASKFLPAVGSITAATLASALTYAIGELMDHYFRQGRAILPAEMRSTIKRLYREKLEALRRGVAGEPGGPAAGPLGPHF